MIERRPEDEKTEKIAAVGDNVTRGSRPRVGSLKAAGALAYDQDMRVDQGQAELTRTRVLPAMPAILERLRVFRDTLDRECAEHRRKVGADGDGALFGLSLKAYPIGFCRIIRDAVWDRAMADPGFVRLLAPGVIVRRVFILLKDQYFQNAVQVGNVYVDVANDTVWVHKPKLEWALVEEVSYRNAESWDYFAGVAQRYLNVTLFPNRLFPFCFPALPFFAIRATGRIELLFGQDLLFLKDLGEGMPRLQALLANETWMGRALPGAYEELLRKAFGTEGASTLPLKFVPSSNRALQDGVVAEFIGLGRMAPEPAVRILDRYMRMMMAATKQLQQLALAPAPAEIARLQEDGLIPRAV